MGDHATYHARYDAPLQSDIASIARSVSGWYRLAARADDVAGDAADAVAAAWARRAAWPRWSCRPTRRGRNPQRALPAPPADRPAVVPADTVEEAAKALRSGERAALLLGGRALRAEGLQAASRVATTTGAALLGETFPANLERGAGIPAVERLGLPGRDGPGPTRRRPHLVLVDAASPVSFFAYPDKASDLVPGGLHRAHVGPTG